MDISSKKYVSMFEKMARLQYPKLYERLIRYDEVPSLRRLELIGMFCGMDYVGIDKIKPADFYSRSDHSRVCAFITLLLTGSLKQSLIARFHDCGTYPFAHIKSYKDNNENLQNNDELDIFNIIIKDKQAMKLLSEDKIDLLKIIDAGRGMIVDKERPALCVDRIDGIFSSAHIWTKKFTLEEIEELSSMLVLVFQGITNNISDETRQNFDTEICLNQSFDNWLAISDFLEAINAYTTWQLTKESRYASAFLGEIFGFMEQQKILPNNYFYLTETEIIEIFKNSPHAYLWDDFVKLNKVRQAKESDLYTLNPKTKIRYAYPLILNWGTISDDVAYEEYIKIDEAIRENSGPLYSEISKESQKNLNKYQKKRTN